MKLIAIFSWIALAVTVSAAPKFGVVRITDIYRGLPSTVAMQQRIQEQRDAIAQNTRADRFRTSIMEMQSLVAQIREIDNELNSENGKKLVRALEIKRQETETLRQALEEFRVEEDKRINAELVAATRESLNRIAAAAQQIGRERNLDGVLDASGNSNTGVPVLLYAANAEDLTEDVIGLLGEKAPEPEAETPDTVDEEPKPAPAPEEE